MSRYSEGLQSRAKNTMPTQMYLGQHRNSLSHRWMLRKTFQGYQGATQGGPFSPHISNVIVDAIVREWFHQVFGEGAARLGMCEDVAICFDNLPC